MERMLAVYNITEQNETHEITDNIHKPITSLTVYTSQFPCNTSLNENRFSRQQETFPILHYHVRLPWAVPPSRSLLYGKSKREHLLVPALLRLARTKNKAN